MAFVLETLTQEQHAIAYSQKIKQSLKGKVWVSYDWNQVTKYRWVIDRDRNAFFFKLACIEPRDGKDRYLLSFEGEPVVIAIKSALGGPRVSPIELPELFKPRLAEIRAAILDALKILGRRGTGRLNEFDALPLHFE